MSARDQYSYRTQARLGDSDFLSNTNTCSTQSNHNHYSSNNNIAYKNKNKYNQQSLTHHLTDLPEVPVCLSHAMHFLISLAESCSSESTYLPAAMEQNTAVDVSCSSCSNTIHNHNDQQNLVRRNDYSSKITHCHAGTICMRYLPPLPSRASVHAAIHASSSANICNPSFIRSNSQPANESILEFFGFDFESPLGSSNGSHQCALAQDTHKMIENHTNINYSTNSNVAEDKYYSSSSSTTVAPTSPSGSQVSSPYISPACISTVPRSLRPSTSTAMHSSKQSSSCPVAVNNSNDNNDDLSDVSDEEASIAMHGVSNNSHFISESNNHRLDRGRRSRSSVLSTANYFNLPHADGIISSNSIAPSSSSNHISSIPPSFAMAGSDARILFSEPAIEINTQCINLDSINSITSASFPSQLNTTLDCEPPRKRLRLSNPSLFTAASSAAVPASPPPKHINWANQYTSEATTSAAGSNPAVVSPDFASPSDACLNSASVSSMQYAISGVHSSNRQHRPSLLSSQPQHVSSESSKACLANDSTSVSTNNSSSFTVSRIPYEPNVRLPLGEHGRCELKGLIGEAIKTSPETRARVMSIAKLKCATISQLLHMAFVCDLWDSAVDISERFVESRARAALDAQNEQRRSGRVSTSTGVSHHHAQYTTSKRAASVTSNGGRSGTGGGKMNCPPSQNVSNPSNSSESNAVVEGGRPMPAKRAAALNAMSMSNSYLLREEHNNNNFQPVSSNSGNISSSSSSLTGAQHLIAMETWS